MNRFDEPSYTAEDRRRDDAVTDIDQAKDFIAALSTNGEYLVEKVWRIHGMHKNRTLGDFTPKDIGERLMDATQGVLADLMDAIAKAEGEL